MKTETISKTLGLKLSNKINYFFSLLILITALQFSFLKEVDAQGSNEASLIKRALLIPGLEFITIDGREIVKGTLKATLLLVIDASTQLQSSSISENIAASALFAAKNQNNPQLTNSANVNRSTSASSNFSGNSSTPYLSFGSSEATTFSTTWSKKTFKGINYSASFSNRISQSRTYSLASEGATLEGGNTTDDPLNTASLSLGVSVPLYQDWGDINNLPIYRSQTRLRSSKLNTYSATQQLLDTFGAFYWDLAGLWETQKVLKEAIKLNQQLLSENKIRQEAGIINLTDVKQSEIQLLRNQQNLLRIENQIRQVEDQIKIALNVRSALYGFFPSDKPKQRRVTSKFEDLLNKALDNSTELSALNYQIAQNGYDLKEALNRNEPNLDFNVNYTLGGYNKDISSSISQYSQSELHGYQLGLTWTIPLGDHRTPELIKQKKLERAQLDIQTSSAKDQLYADLKSILRNLEFAENDIKKTQIIRELNEEVLNQEIEKQKLGKGTAFQVSQSQQEFISSQSDEIQSLIAYEKLYISLLILTGDIFVQYELPRAN